MIRGSKNYKKKTQMPEWDLNILAKHLSNAEASPPSDIKQSHVTNQAYVPATFAEGKDGAGRSS